MDDKALKHAAVVRAAQHACAVMTSAECHTPEGRQRLRDAARSLQERLNDLYALDKGDAMAAPGIKNGAQT